MRGRKGTAVGVEETWASKEKGVKRMKGRGYAWMMDGIYT